MSLTLFKLLLEDQEILSNLEALYDSYKNNQGDRDFLKLKLAEELNELGAELIQKVLFPTHKDNTDLENELGDTIARLLLVLPECNIQAIHERISYKVSKSYKKRFKN